MFQSRGMKVWFKYLQNALELPPHSGNSAQQKLHKEHLPIFFSPASAPTSLQVIRQKPSANQYNQKHQATKEATGKPTPSTPSDHNSTSEKTCKDSTEKYYQRGKKQGCYWWRN